MSDKNTSNPNITKDANVIWGDKVKVEHIDWLWPNRFPLKMLTLLCGVGGVSKSTFTLYMAAQISRGRPFADEKTTDREPGDTIILSAEDTPSNIMVPRLMAMEADLSRICFLNGVKETFMEGTKDEAVEISGIKNLWKSGDFITIEKAILKCRNPKLIIIDPYTAYMGSADSNSNTEVRSFLRPLADLAEKYNVTILGITHLNKKEDSSADNRLLGSVGQQNAARMAWLIAADPDDFERRCFVWYKGNISPTQMGLSYRLQSVSIKTDDGRESSHPACAFEREPCTLSKDELLAPRKRTQGRPKKQASAEEWLEMFLSEGPVNSKLIFEEGLKLEFSKRTLERVKSAMGIKSVYSQNRETGKITGSTWALKSL